MTNLARNFSANYSYVEQFLATEVNEEEMLTFLSSLEYISSSTEDLVRKYINQVEDTPLRNKYIFSLKHWYNYKELITLPEKIDIPKHSIALYDFYSDYIPMPILNKQASSLSVVAFIF